MELEDLEKAPEGAFFHVWTKQEILDTILWLGQKYRDLVIADKRKEVRNANHLA